MRVRTRWPVPSASRLDNEGSRLRRAFLSVLACLFWLASTAVASGEVVVTNPDVDTPVLSRSAVRAMFAMRMRSWPDGSPVRVFVLADDNPIHSEFAKTVLHTFPHRLRASWDRLVFSGTGQAPTVVDSPEDMRERVADTPGAIGYLPSDEVSDDVRQLDVE